MSNQSPLCDFRRALFAFSCLLAPFFFAAVSANAQTGRGTLIGTVLDSSGASVPSVKISIVQLETNSTYALETNDQGLYSAPILPVGSYKVVATKPGFATVQRQPVGIDAEVQIRVDFTLQPGS